MNQNDIRNAIASGQTALGIEFGSTRIKAVLIEASDAPRDLSSKSFRATRSQNSVFMFYVYVLQSDSDDGL